VSFCAPGIQSGFFFLTDRGWAVLSGGGEFNVAVCDDQSLGRTGFLNYGGLFFLVDVITFIKSLFQLLLNDFFV
jgi:hypothetical protein